MNVRMRHLACCRTGSMHINGRVDRLIFPWVDIEQSRCIITLHRVISAPMWLNRNCQRGRSSFFMKNYQVSRLSCEKKKKKKRTWIFSFFIASRKTSKHLFHLESGTKEEKRLERLNVSINNEASRRYIYIYINVYIYIYVFAFDHVELWITLRVQKYTYCWLGKLSFTEYFVWLTYTDKVKGYTEIGWMWTFVPVSANGSTHLGGEMISIVLFVQESRMCIDSLHPNRSRSLRDVCHWRLSSYLRLIEIKLA